MILDSTKKIVCLCGEATTTPMDFFVAYDDANGPSNNAGTATGSQGDVLAAPNSGIRRVTYMSFNNTDNVTHTFTIKMDQSGVQKFLFRAQLDPGWTLIWMQSTGWCIFDSIGNPRLGGGNQVYSGNFLTTLKWMDLANITTVTAMASGATSFHYLGTCNKVSTNIDIVYKVGTAAVGTATWAEIAIYKGPLVANGNANLTKLGFTDVSGIVTSTGTKKTNIVLSPSAQIGDDLWCAIGGNFATTQWQSRGGLADDLQSGCLQVSAGFRPSTGLSPSVQTIGGVAVVPAWITGFVN